MVRQLERAVARRSVVLCVLIAIVTAPPADATEPPTLESIRVRIRKQWNHVSNLQIRLRQETVLNGTPGSMPTWQLQPGWPEYCGTEDVLFAFDGKKRYLRTLGLDCQTLDAGASQTSVDERSSHSHDLTSVLSGKTLRQRSKDRHGRLRTRSVASAEAIDCFPPPQYLMNVGYALPDPTSTPGTNRKRNSQWILPDAIHPASYFLADEKEQFDGHWCLVLQQRKSPATDPAVSLYDKLWLDAACGSALRKRDLRTVNWRVQIANTDFAEVDDGLWLPNHSRMEYFAASGVAERYQDNPVLVQTAKLAYCIINRIPPELFDVVLTKSPAQPDTLFGNLSAYHCLERFPSDDTVTEVWAAKDRGRRMEVRRNGQLLVLTIDTNQWTLVWRPTLNRANLLQSRLSDHLRDDASAIASRESILRSAERLSALFRVQTGKLGDRRVDKLTAYFPADPMVAGRWPIHGFDSRLQSIVSGTQYRTRENWIDPQNNLSIHRRCGCESPKWERTVDFPPIKSIAPSHFCFRLPQDAQLSTTSEARRQLFLSTAAVEPAENP